MVLENLTDEKWNSEGAGCGDLGGVSVDVVGVEKREVARETLAGPD
jgi:hypothetical protein